MFPPTYSDATYAKEKRRVPGHDDPVECVLLDSVQSQANRIEEALQDAVDEERIQIPVVEVDFSDIPVVDPGDEAEGLYEPIGRVTSLEAPHRVADAILRDSELDGVPFRNTPLGKKIGMANLRNATPLFEICPTALLLGIWDSTGPKGGLGTKFQRAMVSEIIGVNASCGAKTSSRIDPLGIRKDAALIYESTTSDWTLDASDAKKKGGKPILKGKDGKPSEANHGNIVPSLSSVSRDGVPLAGGVTIDYFKLWGKGLPDLVLRLCSQPSPPTKLNNETWTKASTVWASVTPVVLDKFPKQSKTQNCDLWQAEVCQIIEVSCERAGLPAPVQIGINTTSWHRGIPRATAKTRRSGRGQNATAPLGEGFPSLSSRKDLPPKPQLHVCLEFAEPVTGPVLIGSGRFAGYGLCLPKQSFSC